MERKDNEKNYIVNKIINFIKKFIKNHKVNLDCDSLLQFFNEEKADFYNLMNLILNSLGLFNDNVLDNLKELLIIENNNNIEGANNEEDSKKYDISDIDEESSDDSECNNNHTNEIQDINNNNRINNFKDLTSDEMRLINGDMILLEKIEKKNQKKKYA